MGVNQMALKWDLLKINKQELPQITPLQMAENGGIDIEKSLALAMAQPKSLKEKLGGRTVSIDTETLNPETNEMEINRVSKYQPGLLEDIRSGAKENFATGFAAPNWEQTVTPDGRKKGLGYRFGEGLGSFARFAESPLGRGLIMAGIVGASGGSGLEALGYGTGAGLLNQQSRMKDKMYRNELEKMGFDTTGITGYVGDDTFNKIYQSKQLQDNAEYRNALLKGQRLEQDALIAQKQAELQHKKVSEAADRALKSRELDIKEMQIEKEGNQGALGNLQAVNQQLQRFEESFATMPNKLESNTLGRLRNATGFQTKEEANFNSQRQLLFNKIARDLGGEKGVLSDQDIKRIEGALPSYTDSMVQKQAKMQAIYDLLNDRLAVEGGSLNNVKATTGNVTKSGVKYEVID
jgi:hypothetical protein